ncbi:MAG: hypothetical protein MI739_08170 [Bacteroidales bacterium]|nr:hypothetical protein [Bacteroidales bacterium]
MTKLRFLEKRGNRLDFVGTKVVPFLNKNQLQKIKGGIIDEDQSSCKSKCYSWYCVSDCVIFNSPTLNIK